MHKRRRIAHAAAEAVEPTRDGNKVTVRARYAAFAQRQPDFLMRTTHPEGEEWNSDTAAWKKELLGFTDSFFFAGLKVGEVKTLGDDKASVKFTANLVRKEGVIPFDLEETSEFVRGFDFTILS